MEPKSKGNKTSEQDLEDSEDNVPLKELVRKESAQPENVSATETKCYEEYIMKRNERLQTNQEETVREKSAPKGKDSIAKGKTDPKDKAILDLVDITKQHQTSGAKEGTSKRKLDITCGQSGKADPPQPGQPLDFVKRHRQVSISSDLEDVPLQQLDDEDDDYEDLGGIWENEIDYLPNTGQISEDVKIMKDWLESLHGKFEVMFNMMSAIEARLAAIEAGICLVPFSLQDPRSEPAENNDLTAQLPIHSASPQ
ncbi:hypothetical protein P5673_015263 [Acropora cervicornis]|uniref:Uncharacterized protein n=1 Tax=Acropora cervicornis TaxID=6130 RepID=A0AAD9QIC6_ACRCE|nr:hypothetical protein P5673_015263 [Acropora cervicornis]